MARVPARARLREFRDAVGRRPLLAGGPRLGAHRARLDGAPAPCRLPDGLRHVSRLGRRAPDPRRARGPAVLDELPDPGLCLDRHPQARGAAEPPAHRLRAHRGAAVDPQHHDGGLYRHRLCLSALHGAAALRLARAARPGADRGRAGSRRAAGDGVLDRHRVAVGRHRRLAPVLHPDRRRIRHPRSSRRLRHADDRPDAVERVLLEPRLAARRGGRGRDAAHHRHPDRRLSRARGAPVRGPAMRRRLSWLNATALTFGFAFLYLPILILVAYSFNASQLVTVWGGFSTRWYAALMRNEPLRDAAFVTIRIALLSATAATVLGTLAAVALVRYRRFRGRALFTGMVYAPMVMPEVITGLSLLLLFVAVGMDRGFWTVTLAHVTFTMCFVTVVVQSRLVTFDRSLEEAALDLGATPARAFFSVTLPLILPAVAAGCLLAFTLSLDDLVIASFTSGPGATTLPMRIYSQVRLGVTPEINAASTLMIAVVSLGVVAAALLTKRRAGPPAGP